MILQLVNNITMRRELIDKIEKLIDVPKECIYPVKSTEHADKHLNIDGIDIYYNYRYTYVDVIGLEKDEFEELVSRYPSMYSEEESETWDIDDESCIAPEIEEQPQEAEDEDLNFDEFLIEKWAYDDYERQCMEGL